MLSTTLIMLAPGRCTLIMTAGTVFIQAARADVLGAVNDVRHVRQPHGCAVPARNNQGTVIVAGEELIVGPNRVGLAATIKAALGLVHIGLGNGNAQVFQRQPVRAQRRRIGLNAWPASDRR